MLVQLRIRTAIDIVSGNDAVSILWGALAGAGRFLMPMVIVLMLAGLVASGFQNVPSLVTERIRPQFRDQPRLDDERMRDGLRLRDHPAE